MLVSQIACLDPQANPTVELHRAPARLIHNRDWWVEPATDKHGQPANARICPFGHLIEQGVWMV